MMRMAIRTAVLVFALVVLGGCSRQSEQEAAADAADVPHANLSEREESAAAAPEPAKSLSPPPMQTQLQSAVNTQAPEGRRFIRTASVAFRVRDVYRSALAIEDLAAKYGGFVERNNIRAEMNGGARTHSTRDGMRVELATYTLQGALTLRVPSERTQEFLRALAEQIEFLDTRNFEATDAQFDLLRQQLAFARHQDAQQVLAQAASAPGKTGDRTEAIGARADAQAQRDEAAVARAELEDRIAFARIGLALHQSPQLRRTERPDLEVAMRREGPGFFTRIGQALTEGGRLALDLLVGIVYLWPLWLAAAHRTRSRRPVALRRA